ncbi:hypothetical protein ACLQ2N_32860 [Streptomyces sp. DT224]|uniref:hypothetical protein n=1 Tax=Streptomyces sp. DT224 TaxID=3393426 RepID=UPI003CF82DC9
MTSRRSREVMAWQPPVGWHELSGERRSAYLRRQGIEIPLKPADWEEMTSNQRSAYWKWHGRILHDTPEARAAKMAEYRKDLRAWRVLMCWWVLCFATALGIVWGAGRPGDSVFLRAVATVFTVGMYAVAIFIPMQLTKPELVKRDEP